MLIAYLVVVIIGQIIFISYKLGEPVRDWKDSISVEVISPDYYDCAFLSWSLREEQITGSDLILKNEGRYMNISIAIYEDNELFYQPTSNKNNIVDFKKYSSTISFQKEEIIYLFILKWENKINTTLHHGWEPAKYINGALVESSFLGICRNTGEQLWNYRLGQNELFLTLEDNKVYFYNSGNYKIKDSDPAPEFASIYYRELENFEEKIVVHTFDFTVDYYDELIGLGFNQPLLLRFKVEEEGIRYELVSIKTPNNYSDITELKSVIEERVTGVIESGVIPF